MRVGLQPQCAHVSLGGAQAARRELTMRSTGSTSDHFRACMPTLCRADSASFNHAQHSGQRYGSSSLHTALGWPEAQISINCSIISNFDQEMCCSMVVTLLLFRKQAGNETLQSVPERLRSNGTLNDASLAKESASVDTCFPLVRALVWLSG